MERSQYQFDIKRFCPYLKAQADAVPQVIALNPKEGSRGSTVCAHPPYLDPACIRKNVSAEILSDRMLPAATDQIEIRCLGCRDLPQGFCKIAERSRIE
ncbi:hypothetical protein M1116_02965 [Patescibacteria group bacterium]|nr:hypothetical protein [Patescibacteria group bacterium]